MKEKKRLDYQQRVMAAGMLWMAGVVELLACEQWLPSLVGLGRGVLLGCVVAGVVVLLRYWRKPAEDAGA